MIFSLTVFAAFIEDSALSSDIAKDSFGVSNDTTRTGNAAANPIQLASD